MLPHLPDEYVRAQTAVGALVLFGAARVIAAALGAGRGWRVSAVTRVFLGAAAAFCLPQLIGMLDGDTAAHTALVELEGKAIGCALALFWAPVIGHKLGYE
jgi:hypothetical protein